MDLRVTSKLLIVDGHALLPFPPVLKRDALKATIQCHSLCFEKNAKALNEPFFLICSSSTHRAPNNSIINNVLGMFQNEVEANRVTFDHSVPLTYPQDHMEIEIVDYHGKRQAVGAMGVFTIAGKISNSLLT